MRSTFYDALRAAPTYPRRTARGPLLMALLAIGSGFGWFIVAGLLMCAVLAVGLRPAADWRDVAVRWLTFGAVVAVSLYVLVRGSAFLLVLLALAFLLVLTARWLLAEVASPFTTRGVVERRGDRGQRAGGVASPWDIAERASRIVMQRRAVVMRPSLKGVPPRKVDPWEVASLVAVLDGWRGLRRLTRPTREVWVICRDATLHIGGPGTGKTVSLARIAAKAPGALLTTSTRLDLAELVHETRKGRPVHIFNPTGYGNVPSTVLWSILVGCEDYSTAVRRSADLIPESDSAEGERWDGDARLYLPVLLHAAAVARKGVEQVQQWLRDIALDETAERAQRDIVNILARDAYADERIGLLRQFVSTTSKTRSGILKSMTPALAWMSDDVARRIGAAPLDAVTLDIRQLILNCETLHIVGPDASTGMMSPLTSALVAEIAEQVRMLAGTMPGERLDPPLKMVIDEAAVTVRLPLPEWSADFGGRGIAMHFAVQSLSQLTERWGAAGAGTLRGNVGTLILFGGGKDAGEMEEISKLAGEYRMRVVGEDHDSVDGGRDGQRRGEWRWRPVLTPADLSNLPPFHAAVLQRNLGGPVIARIPTTIDDGIERQPLVVLEPVLAGEIVNDQPFLAGEPVPALLPVPRTEAVA